MRKRLWGVWLGAALLGAAAGRAGAAQGARLYDEDIPTKTDSLVYVLSNAAAMLRPSPLGGSQFDRAKAALIRSIERLPSSYSFNVVAFNCSTQLWSAAKQKAEPGPKASAIGWVQRLSAQGGTGSGQALVEALSDRDTQTLALVSNAEPGCGSGGPPGPAKTPGGAYLETGTAVVRDGGGAGDRQLEQIRAANVQRAAIHCFGLGARGAFETFCNNVAASSGGTYHPVP